MNSDYQNQNPNTSVNSDEDDEYGSGRLTLELFHRSRKKTDVTSLNTSEVDEDDEYGGAKLTAAMIYGQDKHSSLKPITPISNDEDDEYGGGRITVEMIKRKQGVSTEDVCENSEACEEEIIYESSYPIFAPPVAVNEWYIPDEKMFYKVSKGENITIPLVVDTEFGKSKNHREYAQSSRRNITTQVKGWYADTPKTMFSAENRIANQGRAMSNVPLLPVVQTDFHPTDYLRFLGLKVSLREGTESKLRELPKCQMIIYGHFLTAELNQIAEGTLKQHLKNLQRSLGSEQIASSRRMYAQTIIDGYRLDWVSTKHIITIEGYEYELTLKFVDTGAIHGVASYKAFCEAVGWQLVYKDHFTSQEKAKMVEMAIERWKDFEEYGLGDLDVGEGLKAYFKKWQEVYNLLELTEYFQCPKLTIGGTVKDLFEAALAKKLGIQSCDDEGSSIWRKTLTEIVNEYIKPNSANDLRQYSTHTRALLSKVEGGRCRNNRPTDVFARRKIKGKYDAVLICDIDISGCYGEGQRNQEYFLGNPEIFDYKVSKNNQYIFMRKWLETYGLKINVLVEAAKNKNQDEWNNPENWGEFVSGAYQARFSSLTPLKYSQDFFASWFSENKDGIDVLVKTLQKMKSDTELQTTDQVNFDEDCGTLKIFNKVIHNAVLTHDGLQWILAIASDRQRNELLDNCVVLSSAVYPRSQRITEEDSVKALEILKETHKNWKGQNTTERNIDSEGKAEIVNRNKECHAWFGINLGDILIDKLLTERKKAQHLYGKKSPLDQLFKLCVNTLYGDMVSKYFVTSNPVVGNNITGRARALAWYMEKGFHGWQSITDGCQFELSKVIHPKNKSINGEIVNLHRKNSDLKQRNVKRAPLGDAKDILGEWNPITYTEWNDNNKTPTEVTKQFLTLVVDGQVFAPVITEDKEHAECQLVKSTGLDWIDKTAMIHLQNLFPVVDVLHTPTTSIKVKDNLEVEYKERKGQFSFETKDIYYEGAFHGTGNYIMRDPNGAVIKMRAYEQKREHFGFTLGDSEGDEIVFLKTERYGAKANPAKDFMTQLLESPENIQRQLPAIKEGILKVSDYKNLHQKYDELGLEPGDTILKLFILQEFSLSQFTFETYEQYKDWKSIIDHLKKTDKQSLEGYFLNQEGQLDFPRMAEWVDEQIANGKTKPFDLLADPNRHNKRAEERAKNPVTEGKGKGKKQKMVSLSHPNLKIYTSLKTKLNLECEPEE